MHRPGRIDRGVLCAYAGAGRPGRVDGEARRPGRVDRTAMTRLRKNRVKYMGA